MPSGSSRSPLEDVVPAGCTCGIRNDAAGEEVRDVRVSERRPETRYRIDVAQRPDQRRLVEAEHREHVVDQTWKPRALGEQVEDAELARDPGVLHLEIRVEVDDTVVPFELAAIDHDGDARCEKRLRVRADLEDRARIDRLAAALAAHAEALGVDQLVANNDADGETRDVEDLHPARGIGLQLRDHRLDATRHGCVGRGGFIRMRQSREGDAGHGQKEGGDDGPVQSHGIVLLMAGLPLPRQGLQVVEPVACIRASLSRTFNRRGASARRG